jgi:hypothetical protein
MIFVPSIATEAPKQSQGTMSEPVSSAARAQVPPESVKI